MKINKRNIKSKCSAILYICLETKNYSFINFFTKLLNVQVVLKACIWKILYNKRLLTLIELPRVPSSDNLEAFRNSSWSYTARIFQQHFENHPGPTQLNSFCSILKLILTWPAEYIWKYFENHPSFIHLKLFGIILNLILVVANSNHLCSILKHILPTQFKPFKNIQKHLKNHPDPSQLNFFNFFECHPDSTRLKLSSRILKVILFLLNSNCSAAFWKSFWLHLAQDFQQDFASHLCSTKLKLFSSSLGAMFKILYQAQIVQQDSESYPDSTQLKLFSNILKVTVALPHLNCSAGFRKTSSWSQLKLFTRILKFILALPTSNCSAAFWNSSWINPVLIV